MTGSPPIQPRLLTVKEAQAAARVHREAFDARYPWLVGLHTPEEDARFYREQVFPACAVWGVHDGAELKGFIAFGNGWVEQLYVVPAFQGLGHGGRLLDIAMRENDHLQLWTFQRNAGARLFYEKRGFKAIDMTDGAATEEKEPDILYRWEREA